MIIGVPKEIKNNENRVGMTPSGVAELVKRGHTVYIQHTAGENSGFQDEAYTAVGAQILPTMEETYAMAQMIVKVKEPIAPEYRLIRKEQLLFTYFHFASDRELTLAMIENGSVCLAYETVEKADHSLPLLIPMSEVAGRMAIQEGARFLEKPQGGKGILPGGVPGVKPAKVLILGGGIVGSNAAQMAAGLGADVTIADINLSRLRYLSETLPKNVKTLYASEVRLKKELPDVDLVVGSVLIPGDKAPHLITRDMLKMMQPGTVLVDVAIDQGGCFETSHPTTRWNRTLCCSQYSGGSALHLYIGIDQRHSALCHSIGKQRMEKGMQGRSGAGFRSECGRRESGISSDSRCIRPEIRAIELRINEFHHGVTEG